jgi:hypothetical protein
MSYVYEPVTEERIRQWAYDPEMDDLEPDNQDWDLTLHDPAFVPLLITLADDEQCPQAEFILANLDSYMMFLALDAGDDFLAPLVEAIDLAGEAGRAEVRGGALEQEKRLDFRRGIGPVDWTLALEMGQTLLNGLCRNSEISLVDQTETNWVVQLSVPPFHRHRELLLIDKKTGRFRHSRYNTANPEWLKNEAHRKWLVAHTGWEGVLDAIANAGKEVDPGSGPG